MNSIPVSSGLLRLFQIEDNFYGSKVSNEGLSSIDVHEGDILVMGSQDEYTSGSLVNVVINNEDLVRIFYQNEEHIILMKFDDPKNFLVYKKETFKHTIKGKVMFAVNTSNPDLNVLIGNRLFHAGDIFFSRR